MLTGVSKKRNRKRHVSCFHFEEISQSTNHFTYSETIFQLAKRTDFFVPILKPSQYLGIGNYLQKTEPEQKSAPVPRTC